MRIDVSATDARVSKALRAKLVRRVLLALSRYAPRIRRVAVRLAEPANPLEGVDQRCRMTAWLHESDGVHSEVINGGIESAVARAAELLANRVGAAVDGAGRDGGDRWPGARPPARPARRRRTR